jgi:phosphatidylethanolamine/phosphatidyl-N-methylethanolamine N-methyltransferase
VSPRRAPSSPARPGSPQRRRKDGAKLGERLQDEARFLRSWLDNPSSAGAIAPSGPALARAMAAAVDPHRSGPVVELGPGTGPVTEALIEYGIDEGRLVLVEFDPDFVTLLKERFPRATIIRGDAYSLSKTLAGALSGPAAAVVSSLPLLNRPEAERVSLLADALALMQHGAPFVQFTYGLLSPVPREAGGFTAGLSAPIWRNIPPARVWTYRADGSGRVPALPAWRGDLIDRVREEWKETATRVRIGLVERTGKVKDDLRRTGDKVRRDLAEQTLRVRRDVRLDETLRVLRRIAEHMESSPDIQIAADRDLRGKAGSDRVRRSGERRL